MDEIGSCLKSHGGILMASQPTPPKHTPRRFLIHKGLIAGFIKGNQWVLISPGHKGHRRGYVARAGKGSQPP